MSEMYRKETLIRSAVQNLQYDQRFCYFISSFENKSCQKKDFFHSVRNCVVSWGPKDVVDFYVSEVASETAGADQGLTLINS